LGAANLLLGTVRENSFKVENVEVEIEDDGKFREGQSVKLVFRPEDVFLHKPENLTQNYQKLTDGTIEEINFVVAFERVVIRLHIYANQ